MDTNDLAGLILASQEPKLNADRIRELSGGSLNEHLALEARKLDQFRPSAGMVAALDPLASCAEVALDQHRSLASQLGKAAGIPGLSGAANQLALTALARADSLSWLPDHSRSLVDPTRVEEIVRRMEGLVPEQSSLCSALVADIDSWKETMPASVCSLFDQDLTALRRTTTAFAPFHEFFDSVSAVFGTTLTANDLGRVLEARPYWETIEHQWQRDYLALEDLVRVHHVAADFDEEVDTQPSSQKDADGVDRIVPVYAVACRYVLPAFRVNGLIKQVALRIDPSLGQSSPQDRLVVAIAAAHRRRAADLCLAYDTYLKLFDWSSAPRGSCTDGTHEALTPSDIEDFEASSHTLIELLRIIDSELDHS